RKKLSSQVELLDRRRAIGAEPEELQRAPVELGGRLAAQIPACRRRVDSADHAAVGDGERWRGELGEPASHARQHVPRTLAARGTKIPAAGLVLLHGWPQ